MTTPKDDQDRDDQDVTGLLIKWRHGDKEALDALIALVYRELRGVAGARLMRQILVDQARRSQADKRGGGLTMVALEEASPVSAPNLVDVLALDQALALFLRARGNGGSRTWHAGPVALRGYHRRAGCATATITPDRSSRMRCCSTVTDPRMGPFAGGMASQTSHVTYT